MFAFVTGSYVKPEDDFSLPNYSDRKVHKEIDGSIRLVLELRSGLILKRIKDLPDDHWDAIVKRAQDTSRKPKLNKQRVGVDEEVEVDDSDPDDTVLYDPMFDNRINAAAASDDGMDEGED